MLVTLKMTCWRQHKDRTINFTPGLNAVRGPNEGGKTSMLLAIVYALFGVKAMPQPLAEMVTWGCPVKDLKVSLIQSVRGELYEFIRSESGAECRHSGGVVVGQNEVSKFAEELLGVDRQLATGMMFAGQGGLRGALEDGPKALSQYIEDLSGMDLFDRIMERAGEKWNTGPTKVIDMEIADMEQAIQNLDTAMPNVEFQNADIEHQLTVRRVRGEDLVNAKVILENMERDLAEAKAKHGVRHAAFINLGKAKQSRLAQQALVETLHEDAAKPDVAEAISGLESDLNGAVGRQAQDTAYKAFLALPAHPDMHWDEDAERLDAEMKLYMDAIVQSDVEKAELLSNMREAQAKRVNASACGYCGKDFSDVPEVAAANAKIDADVALWSEGVNECVRKRKDALETHDTLRKVKDSAKPFNDFLAKHGEFVDTDTGFVPPKVTWKGEVPQELPNVLSLQTKLNNLRARQTARAVALAKLEQAQVTLAQLCDTEQHLESTLPVEVDFEHYEGLVKVQRVLLGGIEAEIEKAIGTIRHLESEKSKLFAAYEINKQRWRDMTAALEQKKEARKGLIFHNALLKKIRAARPIVASKLWEIVLASVSTMFSKVRGTQSVVTRTATGFTVNGHNVAGLSGSALDVLGMAMRVALLKSFVPDCSFLILDEPMSACDDERTASMLGFLAACDFNQTVLITHEDMSSASAANLIAI